MPDLGGVVSADSLAAVLKLRPPLEMGKWEGHLVSLKVTWP